jgi:hypothetical protein
MRRVHVTARVPLVPLARGVVFAGATLFVTFLWGALTGAHVFPVREAIRTVSDWYYGSRFGDIPLFNTGSIAMVVVTTLATALVGLWAAWMFLAWRRLPRGACSVGGDARGLVIDERVVVAADEIDDVEVETDRDAAFAVVVRARSGVEVRAAMETEEAAHDLGSALVPSHDRTRVVFDGLAGSRARETVAVSVIVLGALAMLLAARSGVDAESHRQFDLGWWIDWQSTFGAPFYAALLVALFARPLARRFRAGRVALDAKAITVDARTRIAYGEIEAVEPSEGVNVAIALRDGRSVRLAFGSERPIVELDEFVARVRAGMAGAIVATHPSAESSGVRVAVRDDDRLDDEALEGDEGTPERRRALH